MGETLGSWMVKAFQNQITVYDDALNKCRLENPQIKLKRELVFYIFKQYIEGTSMRAELITADERDIETICPLKVLKKIVDRKDHIMKWYCLRNISLTSKGTPQLISDGLDTHSIREYCRGCASRTSFDEKLERTADQILAIQKFGDSDIETTCYACLHPELKFMQILLGDVGELICQLRNQRVDLNKICQYTKCDFLASTPVTFKVKDVEAYKELQKQLEDKR